MQYTDEQKQVIDHQGDAIVNAVAGSGKTSTLVGYAQARPKKRILYLAFNRSVREEAIAKFDQKGCFNVTVETAHSLAYKNMDVRRRFAGLHQGGALRTYEIIELCGLPTGGKKSKGALIMARHIQNLLAMFCNSATRRMQDIDYPSSISDDKAREFVDRHEADIYGHAHDLLSRMYRAEIPVTHDAYLKFYQLGNPKLPFDYILFDEGQDASPVMLDIFLRQKTNRVIVGDEHQSIYGFRQAVNSLAKVDFPGFHLTKSFRFRQEIADLAETALELKKHLGCYPRPVRITGAGDSLSLDSYAVISRTNLKLLAAALDAMIKQGVKALHFEGNLESYTYMQEGASLYDVLYLRLERKDKIRNPLIQSFSSFMDLREYISATEDQELALMVEIVAQYGTALFDYLKKLRALQVPKRDAERVFSTVHRAKGQEYSTVELTEGFMTGERLNTILQKATQKKKALTSKDKAALAEEINILYVALTRVCNVLMLPFGIKTDSDSEYYIYNGGKSAIKPDKAAHAI